MYTHIYRHMCMCIYIYICICIDICGYFYLGVFGGPGGADVRGLYRDCYVCRGRDGNFGARGLDAYGLGFRV